ncbi:MAG: GTPase Era [Bdellovibrionota bacterium]
MSEENTTFKCATVAIMGRPNAGKSTLLNALLESELSATSDRPQTTRTNIRGILQRYETKPKRWSGQLVLVDTPGVNLKKGLLDRSMYAAIEDAMRDVDIGVWVADCRSFEKDLDDAAMGRAGPEDRLALWIKDQLKKKDRTQWLLVLSKADTKNKADLLPLIEKANQVFPEFKEIIPLAALKGGLADARSNVGGLLKVLDGLAPEAPALYGEDDWTDMSGREVVRNLIRECIFRGSYKEVPYETDCNIDTWQEPSGKQKMAEVHATICVSRDSLKRILVGKGGSKIKDIGVTTRARYKEITGEEIILKLFVKVVEKWTVTPSRLKDLGYENAE